MEVIKGVIMGVYTVNWSVEPDNTVVFLSKIIHFHPHLIIYSLVRTENNNLCDTEMFNLSENTD